MTASDWILAGIALLGILWGWRWGTINVVAKIGALILAYRAARLFSTPVAAYIVAALRQPELPQQAQAAAEQGQTLSDTLRGLLFIFGDSTELLTGVVEIVVFIVIFVVVNWLVKRIAYALTSIFSRGLLGSINRALGACVAVVITLALMIIFDDILLPAMLAMGFGGQAAAFMDNSQVVMPLLDSLKLIEIGELPTLPDIPAIDELPQIIEI
ncbi:MAG: CvpA family protein [Bacillota bacterium]|nr:CvpA family protein [Bacillota bacterium]